MTRPSLWLWMVPLVVGCARYGAEREVCDAYLDCAAEVDPESVGALVGQYGSSSACWDDPNQASLCARGCQVGAADILPSAELKRDQCLLAAGGVEPEPVDCDALDAPRFSDAFAALMCSASAPCGDGTMAEDWCLADGDGPPGGDCTFDAAAACDCLSGDFVCSTLDDFAFVEAPEVCGQVWVCPEPEDGTPPRTP